MVECDKFETFFTYTLRFQEKQMRTREIHANTFVTAKNPPSLIIIPFQDLSGNFFRSKASDFFKFLSLYKCRKSLTIKTALMSFNWVIVDQTMQKIYTATQRHNSFNRCILTPNFCT